MRLILFLHCHKIASCDLFERCNGLCRERTIRKITADIELLFNQGCTGKTIAKTVKIKCAHSFGIEHRAQQLKQHAFAAVADTLQQEEYLTIGITGKNIAEHLPDTHLQSVIISGDKTYEIVKVRRTMAQSRQRYIQTMCEKVGRSMW